MRMFDLILLVFIHKFYAPCKKCDVDSHDDPMSFLVTTRRQFVIEIDTKSHDYSL